MGVLVLGVPMEAGNPKRPRGIVAKAGRVPAIFATIHFKSPERPDGYTSEQIAEMNRLANADQSEKPDEA